MARASFWPPFFHRSQTVPSVLRTLSGWRFCLLFSDGDPGGHLHGNFPGVRWLPASGMVPVRQTSRFTGTAGGICQAVLAARRRAGVPDAGPSRDGDGLSAPSPRSCLAPRCFHALSAAWRAPDAWREAQRRDMRRQGPSDAGAPGSGASGGAMIQGETPSGQAGRRPAFLFGRTRRGRAAFRPGQALELQDARTDGSQFTPV